MATSIQTNHKTHCLCNRGALIERDREGDSLIVACSTCRRCWLLIFHPQFQVEIALRDFHRRRGDGPYRPLDDESLATKLVEHLFLDTWPSPATVMDWGIETGSHYGALQHAVLSSCVTAYELDRVAGDGPAITRLVRAVPEQPYRDIEFRTAWDAFAGLDEDEAEAFDESASS